MNVTPEMQLVRLKMARTARDMLDGNLTFIEGARILHELRWSSGLREDDPDLDAFTAITSETDSLSLGEVRAHWAQHALAQLQPEIERAETWAKEFGRAACTNLVRRLGAHVE